MTNAVTPGWVAVFGSGSRGLCAKVREVPETGRFELELVDAISGVPVASRTFDDKLVACATARLLSQ